MSKAGRKFTRSETYLDARTATNPKTTPAAAELVKRMASESDVMGMFFWLNDLVARDLRKGKPVTLRLQFEFPAMKPKRKRRSA